MTRPTTLSDEIPTLNARLGSEIPSSITSNAVDRASDQDVFVDPTAVIAATLSAAPDGGWSWFTDPRAVFDDDKTYFGYIDSTGNVEGRTRDHDTGTVSAATTIYSGFVPGSTDDHNNPAFLVRASDGKVVVAFAEHVGSIYAGLGTTAGAIPAQAQVANISADLGGTISLGSKGYTYANLVQLTGEASDPIYLFTRFHDDSSIAHAGYSKANDTGGALSWSARVTFADVTYHKVAQNGDARIDIVFSRHPDDASDSGDRSIWHAYYEGGNLYKSDGTLIGAIDAGPYEVTSFTEVYDGSTTKGWLWDIAVAATGEIVIAYATFPGNDGSDHRANIAVWDGSTWTNRAIVAMGTTIAEDGVGAAAVEAFYSGGIVLDHESPLTRAYVSIEDSGAWDLYIYTSADDWATTTAIAIESSAAKNFRPVSVRGHDGSFAVLWMGGTYESYVDYSVATLTTGAPVPVTGGLNATDGNDATYVTSTGTLVVSVDLGDDYRIVRSRLFVGTTAAGSRTYTIEGANEADFSDATALDSTTFTATGSFTGQQVLFSWDPAFDDRYRFFRVVDTIAEARRVYSFELYEADLSTDLDEAVDDHEAAADPHPQYLTQAEADALYGPSEGYFEPVTNGDTADPELIFAAGDVVVSFVEF